MFLLVALNVPGPRHPMRGSVRFQPVLLALIPVLALTIAPACATAENRTATPDKTRAAAGDKTTEASTPTPKASSQAPFLFPTACVQMFDCIHALAAATPAARGAFENAASTMLRATQSGGSDTVGKICSQAMTGYGAMPNAPAVCLTPGTAWTCDKVCTANGLCTKDLTRGGCVATSAALCKASTGCTKGGYCAFSGRGCVPGSDADCKSGAGCGFMGNCSLKGTECVPSTAQHCAASTVACKEHGACALVGTECGATTDAMCRASESCASRGDCGAKDGVCEPKTEADCMQSGDCKRMGYCGLKDDTCAPTSDAHCKRSQGCKDMGLCTFDAEEEDCVEKDNP